MLISFSLEWSGYECGCLDDIYIIRWMMDDIYNIHSISIFSKFSHMVDDIFNIHSRKIMKAHAKTGVDENLFPNTS